jgi:hypothetical protein
LWDAAFDNFDCYAHFDSYAPFDTLRHPSTASRPSIRFATQGSAQGKAQGNAQGSGYQLPVTSRQLPVASIQPLFSNQLCFPINPFQKLVVYS